MRAFLYGHADTTGNSATGHKNGSLIVFREDEAAADEIAAEYYKPHGAPKQGDIVNGSFVPDPGIEIVSGAVGKSCRVPARIQRTV